MYPPIGRLLLVASRRNVSCERFSFPYFLYGISNLYFFLNIALADVSSWKNSSGTWWTCLGFETDITSAGRWSTF